MNSPTHGGLEATPGGSVPLRLPDPEQIFHRRSARFAALAVGHALGDYLAALAKLAQAQSIAAVEFSPPLRGSSHLADVPLSILDWRREVAWRQALDVIVAEMRMAPLPEPSLAGLERLRSSTPSGLESFADALLAGEHRGIDLAAAPFLGAALQVYWTALASRIPLEDVGRSVQACPVCASRPAAAVVFGNEKLRYLECSLCASQWHLTRVTCANCGSTSGISYFNIEGDSGTAQAEACEQCRTYLKLFPLESSPSAEPFADDVATLALDFLMSDKGYSRTGVNFFLLPGPDS